MSVYNHVFLQKSSQGGAQLSPQILMIAGPLLQVEISFPTVLAERFAKENKPLPQPKVGWALIDTGATRTCVDDEVITQLGVNPIGRTTINGSAGGHEVNIFPSHLRFPSIPMEIDFTATLGVNIQAQKFNNQSIVALIGRDVLSRCVLIYNGVLGSYTLTF